MVGVLCDGLVTCSGCIPASSPLTSGMVVMNKIWNDESRTVGTVNVVIRLSEFSAIFSLTLSTSGRFHNSRAETLKLVETTWTWHFSMIAKSFLFILYNWIFLTPGAHVHILIQPHEFIDLSEAFTLSSSLLFLRKAILCIHGLDEQSQLMKYYVPTKKIEGWFEFRMCQQFLRSMSKWCGGLEINSELNFCRVIYLFIYLVKEESVQYFRSLTSQKTRLKSLQTTVFKPITACSNSVALIRTFYAFM